MPSPPQAPRYHKANAQLVMNMSKKFPPPFELLNDKHDDYIQWFIRSFEEKYGKGSWEKTLAEKWKEHANRHGVVRDSVEQASEYIASSNLPERFPNCGLPWDFPRPEQDPLYEWAYDQRYGKNAYSRDFLSSKTTDATQQILKNVKEELAQHPRDTTQNRETTSPESSLKCEVCGYTWIARTKAEDIKQCPQCDSRRWRGLS